MYGYYLETLQGLMIKRFATLEETKKHYNEDKYTTGVISLSPIYKSNLKMN